MSDCIPEAWLGGPQSLALLAVIVLLLALLIAVVVVAVARGRSRPASTGRGGTGVGLVVLAVLAVGAVVLGGAASPAGAASANPRLMAPSNCATVAIGPDRDVVFESGGVEFHASFRGPVDPSRLAPAVVIVVGTGGVDRNGDAETLATRAYEWLADVMSANGIASLRYDKLGTGATGLGPYASDPDAMLALGYDELRIQPIRDALSFVAAQPGVDPDRILLLGHSEGGGDSLVVATNLKGAPELAGLLLIEPLYAQILDVLTTQFTTQIDAAVAAGVMTTADAATLTTWMAQGIDEIRSGTPPLSAPAPVPIPGATDVTALYQGTIASNIFGADPAQMVVSHAYRTRYGKQFDEVVPDALAPMVDVPTLITCGTKDFNTPCGDGSPGSGVVAVAAALPPEVSTFVIIPDMVHILRDTGTSEVSQTAEQVDYPFSLALESVIGEFLRQFGGR